MITPGQIVPGVTPTDDFLVYLVESSETGNAPYRCDMQRFWGNGVCECPEFQMRRVATVNGLNVTRRQALEKGAMPSLSLKCKHLVRVDRYIAEQSKLTIIYRRLKESNANKSKAKGRAMGQRIS